MIIFNIITNIQARPSKFLRHWKHGWRIQGPEPRGTEVSIFWRLIGRRSADGAGAHDDWGILAWARRRRIVEPFIGRGGGGGGTGEGEGAARQERAESSVSDWPTWKPPGQVWKGVRGPMAS